MSILGDTTSQTFLERYWQKEPLLVRQSANAVTGPATPLELFDLACDEDVESRLVVFDERQSTWTCEQGPFDASRFEALPDRGWTLLVQAVDQWIPEVAVLLSSIDFLARWRLDDVMVSCAATGGGVGPHFDYYDVFLVQVAGSRHWQVGGRCDEHTPLLDHPTMKLLAEFSPCAGHDLVAGDVLYLPPGVSHWGTATSDDCVTYSVGFRAPAYREILSHAAQILAEGMSEGWRYEDKDGCIDADPYRINESA
ncbi:MAG: cupin domain-containing protein, partial [Gammaproteobacteria bacterium]